jgi:hypothetical protein
LIRCGRLAARYTVAMPNRCLALPLVLFAVCVGCGDTTAEPDPRASGGAAGTGAGNAGKAGGSAGAGGAGATHAAGHAGVNPGGAGGVMLAGRGGSAAGSAGSGNLGGNAGSAAGAAGAAEGGMPGVAGGSGSAGAAGMGGQGGSAGACTEVTPVPEAVRTRLSLDPFYEKHVDARGLSVLGSAEPSDESLRLACKLVNNMLSQRDDVRQELIRRKARFAIIGKDEGTAEIPEYGYRDGPQEDIDYINQRARGLGGLVASCGEENILCLDADRYPRESICVHEFSHTISTYGLYSAEDGFEAALEAAYDAALASGILDDSYRNSSLQEYWAEGVQDWYDTNDWADPPNGIHNQVNTRVELEAYDPTLYAMVADVSPADVAWGECREN